MGGVARCRVRQSLALIFSKVLVHTDSDGRKGKLTACWVKTSASVRSG